MDSDSMAARNYRMMSAVEATEKQTTREAEHNAAYTQAMGALTPSDQKVSYASSGWSQPSTSQSNWRSTPAMDALLNSAAASTPMASVESSSPTPPVEDDPRIPPSLREYLVEIPVEWLTGTKPVPTATVLRKEDVFTIKVASDDGLAEPSAGTTTAETKSGEHRFRLGDNVMFASGRDQQIKGIIKSAYWIVTVAIQQRVIRIPIKIAKGAALTREAIKLTDDHTVTVRVPHGAIEAVDRDISIIPRGHVFQDRTTTQPKLSELSEFPVSALAFNIGSELPRLADGWVFACAPPVVPAKTVAIAPAYRILAYDWTKKKRHLELSKHVEEMFGTVEDRDVASLVPAREIVGMPAIP